MPELKTHKPVITREDIRSVITKVVAKIRILNSFRSQTPTPHGQSKAEDKWPNIKQQEYNKSVTVNK